MRYDFFFAGVVMFGMALLVGAEGIADRIRDHQGTLVSQWIHTLMALGGLFASAYCLSRALARPTRAGGSE